MKIPFRSLHRLPWRYIAITSGLLLLSLFTVIQHLQLRELSERITDPTHTRQIHALVGQLTTLEQRMDNPPPAFVSQSDFSTVHQQLDARLTRLEQPTPETTSVALEALQKQVQQLEARLEKLTLPPAGAPVAQPVKPEITQSPFSVIGVELRGGERFLAISPSKTAALSEVRLLRPGDSQANWQLIAIEAKTAVFRSGSQTRRIPLPQDPP